MTSIAQGNFNSNIQLFNITSFLLQMIKSIFKDEGGESLFKYTPKVSSQF